jgi:uncharacterized membrane protein YfcA
MRSPSAAFAVVATAVTLGALVQGAVGLGLGLVAAPVVTLVDHRLMPGVMLWLAAFYPLLTLAHEGRHVDWPGLGWAFSGRLPGTVVGVAVVSYVSGGWLGLLVGAMVLVAVLLTWKVFTLPRRRPVLAGMGVISGVTGTATSIGGPPLALVYQDVSGPRLRATMGAYFVGGGMLSLGGLAIAHELDRRAALWALGLAPFLLVGFALAGLVRRHIDAGRTRAAVLVVCAASAVALITRSVIGLA